jgi:hypothetical protein
MHPAQSWLRELLKLFVQYMAVAFCSIPATAIYFLVLKVGGNGNWAMTASLLAGFSCAYLVWKFLDTIILPNRLPMAKTESIAGVSALARTPMSTGIAYSMGGSRLAAGFAVTIVVSSGILTADADLSRPTSRIAIRDTITSLEGLNAAA